MKKICVIVMLFALLLTGCRSQNQIYSVNSDSSSASTAKGQSGIIINPVEDDTTSSNTSSSKADGSSKTESTAHRNESTVSSNKGSDNSSTASGSADSSNESSVTSGNGSSKDSSSGFGTADNSSASSTVSSQTTSSQTTSSNTSSNSSSDNSGEKMLVNTRTEITDTKTVAYKYGVTKTVTTKKIYGVYSDNSEELLTTESIETYNNSAYSAEDKDLLEESNTKAAANGDFYKEVLRLVNEIRVKAGAEKLTLDNSLCKAATMRAVEMNYSGVFDHKRPNGTEFSSVFANYPISYKTAGENIAAGYKSPEAVVEGWKNSEGHYKNMINPDFTKLGVGMSNEKIGDGIYWVQLFTN